jgi:hypothetical protein
MNADSINQSLADQFRRTILMFENAVRAYPASEWRRGDLPYLRPAGLAYHLADTMAFYISGRPDDPSGWEQLGMDWETPDADALPDQAILLGYLGRVKTRLETWLAESDFLAEECLYPWTGPNVLGRAMYLLRHNQHHVAELYLELHRRGLPCPEWE